MSGSVPKEIPGIPAGESVKIVHLPTQDDEWRKKVAHNAAKHLQHVQKLSAVGHLAAKNEVTPVVAQPIPKSKELDQFGAERVGEEPEISGADIKNFVDTAGTPFGGVNPDTFDRTVKGHRIASFVWNKLLRRNRLTEKAA